VISPVLHKYAGASLALKIKFSFKQIVVDPDADIVGTSGLDPTVITTGALSAEVQFPLIVLSVYIPAIEVVSVDSVEPSDHKYV
jgi:hypothetical protein